MAEWIQDPAILASHLADESGLAGTADAIIFPTTIEEVAAAVADMKTITIQGSKTGFCAGAVPAGGAILNLSRLNTITTFTYSNELRTGTLTVQAGCTLEQVNGLLAAKGSAPDYWSPESKAAWERYRESGDTLWFLPNPTETNASLGGIAATGSSGSRVPAGRLADHFETMTAVRANGEIGAVDSLCGSEGVLAVIADMTLRLSVRPPLLYGLMTLHANYDEAATFGKQLTARAEILAVDWFDIACRDFLASHAATLPPHTYIPDFPPGAAVCVWTEAVGTEAFLLDAMELLEAGSGFADAALAATVDRDRERIGTFRHVLTETCNRVAAGTRSPILDWCSPDGQWASVAEGAAALFRREGVPFVLMGHARDGRTSARAPGLLDAGELVDFLQRMGCSASGEHGYGRAKRELFAALSPDERDRWRRLRTAADPGGVLNPRVMVMR
ncbi:MAG: FAD-binding oxidoreductase [Planctomycetaceae bacterium]|nr:FAD-binding oxidoreductase [Planctomycetaceae bacterium]